MECASKHQIQNFSALLKLLKKDGNMLDFFLDIGDDNSFDQRIEGLQMEEFAWLLKMRIIEKGTTGFVESDESETLTYLDDFKLTYIQVKSRLYSL